MAWASRSLVAITLAVAMLLAPSEALTSANGFDYTCTKPTEASIPNGAKIPVERSVCYSPFHDKEYPLLSSMTLGDLQSAMDEDFRIMSKYFTTVRTYYSAYMGIPVAPIAASHGMKLYLGVYMTEETWYSQQVDAAVQAVKDYPDTISAIMVGNENIAPAGAYSAVDVKNRINSLRSAIEAATGRTDIPIGTVQRSTEWLSEIIQYEMGDLADACDIIGVNIYPFFDSAFTAGSPSALLEGTWNNMAELYESSKLRITETGWPTDGTPVSIAPNNIPSVENAKLFYDAFTQWTPAAGGGEIFWFMFFDRAPYDNTLGGDIEKYFGFYTWEKDTKMNSGFPFEFGVASTTAIGVTTSETPEVTTSAPTSEPTPEPTPTPTASETTPEPTPEPTPTPTTPESTPEPTVEPTQTVATSVPTTTTEAPTSAPTSSSPAVTPACTVAQN